MAHLELTQRSGAKKRWSFFFLKNSIASALQHSEYWLPSLILLVAIGFWEWGARREVISTLFFPAPSIIVTTLIRSFTSGQMIEHTGATLWRIFLAFMIGGIPAMIIGLAMGWSRRLRAGIDPFVAAAHPVPKIALLPLAMIFFGIGESSKVVTVAAAAFFPMLINCMAGVQQINFIHFEVAKNFRANPWRVLTRVVWPGSLPMVITGARLSINVAFLITISIELVSATKGLGVMIWFAWETLRTEELYAGLIVIAALGIGINLILKRLRRYLVPWRLEHEA
jgi:ABC-type nitrate/sulfonate/bicarbonate transport system permease component